MLTVWVSKNRSKIPSNDFYRPFRNYFDRLKGFNLLVEEFHLRDSIPITYLEFGVAGGTSFEWWLKNARHKDSKFYGFDTFEGLPENWGLFYKKGDMSYEMREIKDDRHLFIKGVFQNTLPGFLKEHASSLASSKQKVIHLDADLFSATLYVLCILHPVFNKGDLLIFDEFSVANHEFFAMDIFQKAFPVKFEPISAINNCYQTIFKVL